MLTSCQVTIDRLLHRELISSHMPAIEDLEKKWNCKITFPSTEQASDVVLISGPEFQVPNAMYDLLVSLSPTLCTRTAKLTLSRLWFRSPTKSPSM
jgi:hypothetical protein